MNVFVRYRLPDKPFFWACCVFFFLKVSWSISWTNENETAPQTVKFRSVSKISFCLRIVSLLWKNIVMFIFCVCWVPDTVNKRTVRILLKCFLVICISFASLPQFNVLGANLAISAIFMSFRWYQFCWGFWVHLLCYTCSILSWSAVCFVMNSSPRWSPKHIGF